MFIQTRMWVFTIYDHEEDYNDMAKWLKENSVFEIFPIGNDKGMKVILDEFSAKRFIKRFDVQIGD